MATTKNTIEDIGKVIKVDNITDKDLTTTLSVLKKVSDKMNVKLGTPTEHIEKIELLGVILSDMQKKDIVKNYTLSMTYDEDMKKSISFSGRQVKTVSKLLQAIQRE
jgi:hypothetical protein